MQDHIFNVDLLAWRCLEDLVAYREMHNFVNNQVAMDAHKSSMTLHTSVPALHPKGIELELQNHMETSLKQSLFHFAAQTIVSLCTSYEVTAKKFFKCLFVKYPLLMHDFLGEDGQKGTIKLKDIVEADDYARLISAAAGKAASVASKGKYGELLVRASKLCKCSFETGLIAEIDMLQSARNKIVHEKHLGPLELSKVADAQSTVFKAIKTLGSFSLAKDLPGNYSILSSEDHPIEAKDVAFIK